ncbi:MAG: bifunctional phosphopantothenoylcysteine decarboxylase/phosphopantothenate--cysteine ligase CoaBC [Myxococcota bacterium]|jgi:phosphopantothenoylcysteine decarboxylase/phosphopantothenate--cysteine ligase|nr:bifunctional phosphopantothenoylcysteine decarboxylase/phosphopantothenate--cysteine ligase CoaBC [Myxococcota bacterium]
MDPRRIVVAVSGGIAAYKAPELVRVLTGAGHLVRCVLTREAPRFVSPLVLETLSQQPAGDDLFDSRSGEIDHIAVADWAELIIVAPTTANLIAKLAHGITDDLVTAVILATRAPVLIAPAMNVNMWEDEITQRNLALLRDRGFETVGPDAGELACGWQGEGRMSDPGVIAEAAYRVLTAPSLHGQRVIVTAGGTSEPIDAVRSITNRSSGKMGFAIAAEAARRGATVVLVAGETPLATPTGVERVAVSSALQMHEVVLRELASAQVVIKAAAVADFRPRQTSERKIKKEDLGPDAGLQIDLVRNPDILADVCREVKQTGGRQVVVGFAAESHDVIPAAQRKLERKGCDLIVANDVSRTDAGFNVDENAVSFIWPEGEIEELALLPKARVAAELLDRVEKLLGENA